VIKTSQERAILSALCTRWLSPLDALREFGCMRLGARIYDLRQAGWQVTDRWLKTDTGKLVKQYHIAATHWPGSHG
jgi:hypothetical protein